MPLGLLVVARHDAAGIERSILSARSMVDTVTVVVDEKFTDEARQIGHDLGAVVIAYPFPDSMAKARNAAIELVRGATSHLLMLDPGDTYEGSPPSELEADVYDVWVHDRLQRSTEVRLFRVGVGVHYEGAEVDRIVVPEGLTRAVATQLIYQRAGNAEEERRAKSEAHIAELLTWASDHPDDAHARFVLGQSYRDAGRYEEARGWYEKRLAFGDRRNEECFAAAMELAFLVEHHGQKSITDVTVAYLRAHELAPLRAEPLFHLACFLRERGAVASAWHFARRASELKVPPMVGTDTDVEIYEWKALAELAIESWMLGDRATATRMLMCVGEVRPDYMPWVQEQMDAMFNKPTPERIVAWPESSPL
jgi:hypothetical protein